MRCKLDEGYYGYMYTIQNADLPSIYMRGVSFGVFVCCNGVGVPVCGIYAGYNDGTGLPGIVWEIELFVLNRKCR